MEGPAALKEAVQRMEASYSGNASGPISRVCVDEGVVSFNVARPGGGMNRISVCFADVASYPACPVFLASEDSSNDDPLAEQLQALSERFQDQSPLDRVVVELLKALGVSSEAAAGKAGSAEAKAAARRADSDDCDMADASGGQSDEDCIADDDDDEGYPYEGMDQDTDAGAGSDGSGEGGSEEEEDDEDERDLMIACGRRQGAWERFEERLKEAEAAAGPSGVGGRGGAASASVMGLSHEEASAKKQQIFEPREAFMMLSKELLDILRRRSYDMIVDSVGDDVYCWSVELASFDADSDIAKDMQEIQRRHQYSFVKLILRFKRGLHPFYPPSVELVRPHFKGCIAAAVAVHPMLRLGTWDPWRPMEDVIRQIKAFLQSCARVELDHPMSDITRYPCSSYRPVEVQLARLNALSGLELSCPGEPEILQVLNSFSTDQARIEALTSDSSKKRTRETPIVGRTVWARGTGYGSGDKSHGQDAVWDARASEAAQRARDEELRQLLESLASHVARDLGITVDDKELCELAAAAASASTLPAHLLAGVSGRPASSSAPAPTPLPKASSASPLAGAASRAPSTSGTAAGGAEGSAGEAGVEGEGQELAPDAGACMAALSSSCLMAFLARELKSASFTDMCTRAPFYLAMLGICKVMGQHSEARQLLWRLGGDTNTSAGALITAMRDSARQYARVTRPVFNKEVEEQKAAAAHLALTQAAVGMPIRAPGPTPQQETLQEMLGGLQLAAQVQDIAAQLQAHPQEATAAGTSGEAAGTSGGSGGSYYSVMQPLQVEYIPDLRSSSHAYASNASSEGVQPKARMSKLAKEIAGLQQLLPLSESSSVLVRVDEENVTLWRALITGPEDTPYSAGCFVFDFYFPPNYPAVPPQVLFKTTGGGRIRFNPNLYNNGKVCLSLLGTWEGAKGEGWNANASTALQVLLSIQSLILVPQPYFNEPGFERQYNSEDGKRLSREYNKDVTEGTLRYAMIDILQHPPKELEKAIKAHFRLRRQAILDQVQNWITAASEWNSAHAATLTSLKNQLASLLAKL